MFARFLPVVRLFLVIHTFLAVSLLAGEKGTNKVNGLSLPISFEPMATNAHGNEGFVSRGRGYRLELTENAATLKLAPLAQAKNQVPGDVVTMEWIGANARSVRPEQLLGGRINYYLDSSSRVNIPTHKRVRYGRIYPGVDLVFYGNDGLLEFDFIVTPGADPDQIRLRFSGAQRISIQESGDLGLHLDRGVVFWRRPVAYQWTGNERKQVEAKFVALSRTEFAFEVGDYDRSKPLIIDPVLGFSTYLGGSSSEGAADITVDSQGNIYVVGGTPSTDFPTRSASQPANLGGLDVFVSKFNRAGELIYSTYLGGSADDNGRGIAVDEAGNAFITGTTDSLNFPTTPGAFQPIKRNSTDAFITKLSPMGAIVFSTYLGGSSADSGARIAVDREGNPVVTGTTGPVAINDFPTTVGAAQTTRPGKSDAFVTKLNSSGSGLVFSTYLGGAESDRGNDIAVDQEGGVYVTGTTQSQNFPTSSGAFQSTSPGSNASFVSKFNKTGQLIYSTYLGGVADGGVTGTTSSGIAVDAAGNAFVTGTSSSSNFPTTPGAYQPTRISNNGEPFISKLNAAGTALLASTWINTGGSSAQDVALNANGQPFIIGDTASKVVPMKDPLQGQIGGTGTTCGDRSTSECPDAFVVHLSTDLSQLLFSTYFGGRGIEAGNAIAADGNDNVVIVGSTMSPDLPIKQAYDSSLSGTHDAYVARISMTGGSGSCAAPSSDTLGINLCSPTNGSTLESPIRVSAAAASPNGIRRIEVWVNGSKRTEVFNSAVEYDLNLQPGSYEVTVVAVESNSVFVKKSATFRVGTAGTGNCPLPSSETLSLNICEPANGAWTSSPVHVSASAAGPNGISRIEVWLDGTKKTEVFASQLEFDLAVVPGTHQLTVVAVESNSTFVKRSVTFTVGGSSGGGSCPMPTSTNTVTICLPTEGSSNGSPVRVTAAANVTGFTAMRIYVDNRDVYFTQSNQIDTSLTLPAGARRMVVVAYSNNGSAVGASRNFVVDSGNTSSCALPASNPAINICLPAQGSTGTSPVNVSAKTRWDGNTVTHVRVYVDNVAKYDAPYPADNAINTSIALSPGTHRMVIVAWNSAGAAITAERTFSVQ